MANSADKQIYTFNTSYNPLLDPNWTPSKISLVDKNMQPGYGIAGYTQPITSQINSIGNTPTATQNSNNTGFFGSVGNLISNLGSKVKDTISGVADSVNTFYTNNFAYPELQNRSFSILNNGDLNSNYALYYSPKELQTIQDRPFSLEAAYMAEDASARADAVDSYFANNSNTIANSSDNTWSTEDWNNAKFLLDAGKFGFDLYTQIMGLNYAKDALNETRTNNAYNRSLSTWQANNDAQAYNTSLQAKLASRQKYNTGSTAGADQLYEQNKLQSFRG